MTLSNIVVSLDASASTPGRVRLACNLARSFDATLTGVAAQDPLPISIYGKGSYLDSNIIEIAAASAKDEISKQQAVFNEMTSGYNKAQLRVYDRERLECMIEECARGDLLVARGLDDGHSGEIVEALSPAEIILRAGRPVLVTPSEVDDLSLGCAIIAWKDTREGPACRRGRLATVAESGTCPSPYRRLGGDGDERRGDRGLPEGPRRAVRVC